MKILRSISNFAKSKEIISDVPEEDGGIVMLSSGKDAPKVIVSTEIVSFDCELSFYNAVFDGECNLEGKLYKISAVLQDEKVKVKTNWHDRFGNGKKDEFEADISLMIKLEEITKMYDLAQYNGYCHHISGLPEMYGEYININYSSGEKIYASDNQDGFLPLDAAKDILLLFKL